MANVGGDATSVPTRPATTGRLWLVIGCIALIVGIDQLTKTLAVRGLDDGPFSIIGDTVEFHLTRNSGGAFGRFQGATMFLAIGAILIAFFLMRTLRRATDPVIVVALVLVLGGALGNLVDRMFRTPSFLHGHVVDFVRVGEFPVFNVADSCITIGGILLVWRSLRTPAHE